MEEIVARAADLIDRLEPMGLSGGLTEEDFIGDAVREPLCTCLSKVAAALSALPADSWLVQDPAEFKAAVNSLKSASSSQRSASSGRLNAALNRLAAAIEAGQTAAASASSSSEHSRVLCAETIVAHLQAAAILAHKQQQQQQQQQGSQQQQHKAQPQQQHGAVAGDMDVDEQSDALVSAQLRAIAKLLGLDDPPSSAGVLMEQVVPQLQELVGRLPPTFFQPLVSLQGLQPPQMQLLQEVDAALKPEYVVRRRMLIERFKVTLQSFLWSPRVAEKGTQAELTALIAACRSALQEAPAVELQQLGSACAADLAGVMRRATSGEGGSIDASVKRVVIGKVPDRGGRPEGRAREANMPDWAPRRESSGAGGGYQGGGGRGGGGRRGGGGGGGRGHQGGGGGGGGRGQQGGGDGQGRGGGRRGGRGGWGRQ